MSPHSGKQSRLAAEEILRFAQNDERGTRLLGIILTILLAISMIPAVGLRSAFADEPVERPATTSGDAVLEGYAAETTPVASQREDGMYVADGLVYTVADGGLSLVGFDGLPEGEDVAKEVVVPEAVSVDGKDTSVVAVDIAEGQVAEGAVSLALPQSINNVDTATLASAYPNLASIEVAAPKASSAPVAAGAAAMKAAYSSFGGILYKNVRAACESDASQTTLTKELVWAPPATVVARIPAECTSIVPGAFAACENLKTVVCFGVMEDIPQTQKAEDGIVTPGAFTDEQIQTVNVIVPQTGTVVPDSDGDRVSASVAVTDHSTMDIKREAWWKSGFASDRITLGEVYGSTTNTLPVTEEGVLEVAEAEVAYAPETTQNSSSRKAGIEPPESAIPTPVPDGDGTDPSESGLVFTHLADMTLSVSWKGDLTATPAHLEIPAYATINGVTYPVTEIASHAFEGAVFLTSVTIPDGVTVIGDAAFANCMNLADVSLSSALCKVASTAFDGASSLAQVPAPCAASAKSKLLTAAGGVSGAADMEGVNDAEAVKEMSSASRNMLSTVNAFSPSSDSMFVKNPSFYGGEANLSSDRFASFSDGISSFSATDESTRVFRLNPRWLGLDRPYSIGRIMPTEAVALKGASYTPPGSSYASITFDVAPAFIQLGCTVGGLVSVVGFDSIGNVTSFCTLQTSEEWEVGPWSLNGDLITYWVVRRPLYSVSWDVVSGKPSTYTPSAHAHVASDITSGTLASDRIPSLDASKITTGALDAARIPSLDAGKIGSGVFGSERIADSAVTGAKIAASAVTNDKIANGTIADGKLASTFVKPSEFGTIAYSGLDDGNVCGSAVFPTSYRQGGSPALPEPERAGQEFLGWTWDGQASPTKDGAVIKGAFAAGNKMVTLTAHWRETSSNCFFADAALDSTTGGAWTSTIAVRLTTDTGKSKATGIVFEANDLTGLLKRGSDGSLPDVTFAVGASRDGVSGAYKFGAPAGDSQLVDMDGGKGVWVRITIPANGIDTNRVVGSMTAEDYVASIARMTFTDIA